MQQQNRPTLAGPPAPGVLGPVYSRPTIHARTPKHPLCSGGFQIDSRYPSSCQISLLTALIDTPVTEIS